MLPLFVTVTWLCLYAYHLKMYSFLGEKCLIAWAILFPPVSCVIYDVTAFSLPPDTPTLQPDFYFCHTMFSPHSLFIFLRVRSPVPVVLQFSKGTYSNLHTQFRTYFAYAVYFQRTPLPASSKTLCGYAQFLSRALKPSSVNKYISGVKTLHTLLGYKFQFSDDFHLQLVQGSPLGLDDRGDFLEIVPPW